MQDFMTTTVDFWCCNDDPISAISCSVIMQKPRSSKRNFISPEIVCLPPAPNISCNSQLGSDDSFLELRTFIFKHFLHERDLLGELSVTEQIQDDKEER